MTSSIYDVHGHQRLSQRRCCSALTALGRFEVIPGLSLTLLRSSPAIPDSSRVLPGLSSALRPVPKLITTNPIARRYQSSQIPVTLKAGLNALLGSDTLLKLTLLNLHSTFLSGTVLEAPSDWSKFCWCDRNSPLHSTSQSTLNICAAPHHSFSPLYSQMSIYHPIATPCWTKWWWWWWLWWGMNIPATTPPCTFVRCTPLFFYPI
jgi:hypothetical protein